MTSIGDDKEKAQWIDEVTMTLRSALEDLNQPPYGLYVEIEDIDYDEPKWTVAVSRFNADVTGTEIEEAQKKNGDLGAALKNIIFEKFQWCIYEN